MYNILSTKYTSEETYPDITGQANSISTSVSDDTSDTDRYVCYTKYDNNNHIKQEDNLSKLEITPYPPNLLVSHSLPKVISSHLGDCIKRSERILKLKDDWDGEGSKGYTEETWKNAIDFLIDYATRVYETHRQLIDIPRVSPGPDGSIDIDWETNEYGLLINIAESGNFATYYGDSPNGQKIEGEFNVQNNNLNLLPIAILPKNGKF